MIVLPAIIPESIEDLETKLLMVKGLVRNVQIDICDGRLTPSVSWPFENEYGEIEEILAQQRGLPLWEHFDFEFDLMVTNPEREYEKWIDAGATRLIFHYKEGATDALKDLIQKTKDRGVEAGLALHLSDPVETLADFIGLIDTVQFMGIAKIGFQGEPFDEQVIARVKKSKELYPDLIVSVDGGVNADTAPLLADAGVNRLVIGSAIFNTLDVQETVGYFKSLM
jgi:ribulose-phosphate 3-epimerase